MQENQNSPKIDNSEGAKVDLIEPKNEMIMQQSYSKKFIQIYFWQILTILSGFLSLFIVMPRLSNNPSIYGVYAICISFNVFLGRADLGFIATGFKYASEAIARNDKESEIKITAFVVFSYYCILFLITIIIFIFAIEPNLFIKNLTVENANIERYFTSLSEQ